MARIETDPNYTAPTFSRATAATDLFKKEDVQGLAAAFSTHVHDNSGKGLAAVIASGSITSAMIADGTIVAGDLADGAVTTPKIADGQVTSAKIQDLTIATADIALGQITQSLVALGVAANPSTTASSYVDMPDLAITINLYAGSNLLIMAIAAMNSNTLGGIMQLTLSYDAVTLTSATMVGQAPAVGYWVPHQTLALVTGAAGGAHQVRAQWAASAGSTISTQGTQRTLVVLELKR